MSTMEERHLSISPREKELVRLIAEGLSEAECAERMAISARTVKGMADTLRHKLGVQRRVQIPMAYWRQTGDDPFPEERQ